MVQKSFVLDLNCDVRVVFVQLKVFQVYEECVDVIFFYIQFV